MLYSLIAKNVRAALLSRVSPTGLGVFRIFLGLVITQEIGFIFYFRHLIFDTVPYLEPASPVIHDTLLVWFFIGVGLTIGLHTRLCAILNYCLWVIFVVFTPMNQEFDGGFDQLITASAFLLIFLPAEKALSLDMLRIRLARWQPEYRQVRPTSIPVICYQLPLLLSLGFMYLDSGIHKLFAEHWRNGLGAWLPAVMPYYVSPLDMSWLLDLEWVEKAIGYTILAFQFVFVFAFYRRSWRVPILLLGISFHLGITLTLNIYPFGLAMLAHYALLVPFAFWRKLGEFVRCDMPKLRVFFDEQCPLCNRTAIVVEHFDICGAIQFLGLQTHAAQHSQLNRVKRSDLLKDLYALDDKGNLLRGLDTYIHILRAMGYLAPVAGILNLPGIRQIAQAIYRQIADNRVRVVCDESCDATPRNDMPALEGPMQNALSRYVGNPALQTARITRFLLLAFLLQLNSTLHYAIAFRLGWDTASSFWSDASDALIDLSHAFLGITPHALYLHDHFAGYEHLIAFTYRDKLGEEQFLPFINEEGRMVAPNWGRVHSMWANMTVTARPNAERLARSARKVTAFLAPDLGIDLKHATFGLKLKTIRMPNTWEKGLRARNLSGEWQDIGTLEWRQESMTMKLREEPDFSRM